MIRFTKCIDPILPAIRLYSVKYIAENRDGSWYGFATKPVIDEKLEEWTINHKLSRPGNIQHIFTPMIGYPDSLRWKTTLQLLSDSRMDLDYKVLLNMPLDTMVVTSAGQIGIVIEKLRNGRCIIAIVDMDGIDRNKKMITSENYNIGYYSPVVDRQITSKLEYDLFNGIPITFNRDKTIGLTRAIFAIIDNSYIKIS